MNLTVNISKDGTYAAKCSLSEPLTYFDMMVADAVYTLELYQTPVIYIRNLMAAACCIPGKIWFCSLRFFYVSGCILIRSIPDIVRI